MSLRCGAYARYSMDRQRSVSIDDQLRKCRQFALREAWQFLEDHIYTDKAVSGATDDRAGLRRLIEAANSKPKPFDIILVDDTSRLSRKLADSLRISEQMLFAGVRLLFVSQGIDTDSEQAEVLLATHGLVDGLYIRELGKKVYRSEESCALRGLHTGGRPRRPGSLDRPNQHEPAPGRRTGLPDRAKRRPVDFHGARVD